MPRQAITIDPDIIFATYAWVKDASDTTPYLGESLASAEYGFHGSPKVSSALEKEFAAWTKEYIHHFDDSHFGWDDFNARGIQLARRLYREIGDRFQIHYRKVTENAVYEHDDTTITSDEPLNERELRDGSR